MNIRPIVLSFLALFLIILLPAPAFAQQATYSVNGDNSIGFTFAPTPTPIPYPTYQPYYPSYPTAPTPSYNYGYNNQYAQPAQFYPGQNYPTPNYPAPTYRQPFFPAPTAIPQPSGIRGTITFGPVCQNLNGNGPCYVPYQAQVAFYTMQGAYAGSATAGRDGRFTINLPAGGYKIVPFIYRQNQQAPQQIISVPNAGYADTAIVYDSGIRY